LYQCPQRLPSFLPATTDSHAARQLTYTHLNKPVNSVLASRAAGSRPGPHDQRPAHRGPMRKGDGQDHYRGNHSHPQTRAEDLWTTEMPAFVDHQRRGTLRWIAEDRVPSEHHQQAGDHRAQSSRRPDRHGDQSGYGEKPSDVWHQKVDRRGGPLGTRACASESDEARTNRLAPPSCRSKSLQDRTPIPGANKHTQASRVGMAGFQWCTASVSHSNDAPMVTMAVRISLPESAPAPQGRRLTAWYRSPGFGYLNVTSPACNVPFRATATREEERPTL
jgi:hypothetical protein